VLAVSDDDRITSYARRKAALRQQVAGAGDGAMALFAADKLSKLRELRHETALDNQGSHTTGRVRTLRARRLRHYQRSLAMLEERLPESALVRDLRHELDAFLRQCATIAATIGAASAMPAGAQSRRARPRPERRPNASLPPPKDRRGSLHVKATPGAVAVWCRYRPRVSRSLPIHQPSS
jgi:hypothetical protein